MLKIKSMKLPYSFLAFLFLFLFLIIGNSQIEFNSETEKKIDSLFIEYENEPGAAAAVFIKRCIFDMVNDLQTHF